MRRLVRILLFVFAALFALPAAAESPRTLYWEDLVPEGYYELLNKQYEEYYASQGAGIGSIAEGSAMDTMPQIGSFTVVEDLDGVEVRLPGFILPFEYTASGEITEFLLVPYFGACIHTPPPPPNQIVYVTAEKPLPLGDLWGAIWAIGTLRTKSNMNDLGDAAYTLEINSWETYDG